MNKELYTDYVTTLDVAKKDPDDIDPRVRPAWANAIAEAKDRLPSVRSKYENAVMSNTAAIYVQGDREKAQQFAVLANEESNVGTVNIDAEFQWRQVALVIDPMIGTSRQVTPSIVAAALDRIKNIAREFGIKDLNPPKVEDFPHLKTLDDTIGMVRDLGRAAIGDSLTKAYITKLVTQTALEKRYTGGILPVVVLNATNNEIMGLSGLFGKVAQTINVTTEDTIDTNFIMEVFKATSAKAKMK